MTKLPRMIAMGAIAFAFGAFAISISFPVQHAEAASRSFTGHTEITGDQTIDAGDTWTVNPGASILIDSGVTISNFGTIDNYGDITNDGTIGSDGTINNYLDATIVTF